VFSDALEFERNNTVLDIVSLCFMFVRSYSDFLGIIRDRFLLILSLIIQFKLMLQDQKMQCRPIWSLNSRETRRDLFFLNGGQLHSVICLLFPLVLV